MVNGELIMVNDSPHLQVLGARHGALARDACLDGSIVTEPRYRALGGAFLLKGGRIFRILQVRPRRLVHAAMFLDVGSSYI